MENISVRDFIVHMQVLRDIQDKMVEDKTRYAWTGKKDERFN